MYDFASGHLLMLLVVFLLQTCFRAIVCANFVQKTLVIARKKEWARPFAILYCLLVSGAIIATLLLSLISENPLTCSSYVFSYHWFLIDVVDLFQSLLILGCSITIVKFIQRNMLLERISFKTISHDVKAQNCLTSQTKLLAASYCSFVFLDFVMMTVGNYSLALGEDFECQEQTNIEATSDGSAVFFFVYSLLLLAFSLTMWVIFYKVPDHYGLVSKTKPEFFISTGDLISTPNLSSRQNKLAADGSRKDSNGDSEAVVTNYIRISREDDLIASSPMLS